MLYLPDIFPQYNGKLNLPTREYWCITAYQYNGECALTFKALQGHDGAIDIFFAHCNA
jgi:hypothetical protein